MRNSFGIRRLSVAAILLLCIVLPAVYFLNKQPTANRLSIASQISGIPSIASAVSGIKHVFDEKKQFTALNDVGIHFYAKVQDQFGDPVPNAEIKCNVMFNTGFSRGGRDFSTNTDAQGYFEIHPGNGQAFGARPEKPGYELASSNHGGFTSYFYGTNRFIPDKNQPVVIKMWKLQGAEPLVRITRKLRLPGSERYWLIDLTSGGIVETGGDLKVSLNRPTGELSFEYPQEWSEPSGLAR